MLKRAFKAKRTRVVAKGLKTRPRPRFRAKRGKSVGIPAYLKCIPEGRHGSGTLQKRLWRLTSDFVRIRDAKEYGKCVATNIGMWDWNQGQAGHYRGYTTCNGIFKFNPMNIHLQTAQSNSWPTSRTWESFANNLRIRYGMGIIDDIDRANRNTALKITTELVLQEIEKRIADIERLEEKPPYWPRLMKLRELSTTSPTP